jgi:phosphoglycolate phosphatase-like HAD superfamily hydrolase
MLFLFDIDGTLIKTGGAGLAALDRAAAELLGVERAMAGLSAAGKTDPLLVDEIFARHVGRAPTEAETVALLERYLVFLAEEVARTAGYQVLPGVAAALDLLEALAATVGLATGNVERGAEIKLVRGDLWRRFPFGGYGSDAADRARLVAHAIRRAERHAGRAFERIYVIGDTERDVAAAHACGAAAIGVATGPRSSAQLRAAGSDFTLETLDELPALLASM